MASCFLAQSKSLIEPIILDQLGIERSALWVTAYLVVLAAVFLAAVARLISRESILAGK